MSTPSAARTSPSAWRRWRTSRPFWGALLICLSGAELLFVVKAPLPVVLHVGMQGMAGYLVPIIILVCGILLLVTPDQRLFYSTIAAVCSLASWATSNLGGFVLGMLLGLVGSALAFAWAPDGKKRKPPPTPPTPPTPADVGTDILADADAEDTAAYAPRHE